MIQLLRRCEVCEGRGTIPSSPPEPGGSCAHCGGDGMVNSGLFFDDTDLKSIISTVGGLTADVGSLGDIMKEIYEIVQKIKCVKEK